VRRSVKALLRDLSARELQEAADFILFLKTRARIDPAQAYFWTSRWQAMERRVEQDKRHGRLLGDGTVTALLRAVRA